MRRKGAILIILGVTGIFFVLVYDKLVGKPVNDISGPKSLASLVICAIIVSVGFYFLKKSKTERNK